MIGLLRFIGLLNAGVWLGASVFFTLGIRPAVTSGAMEALLGTRNFSFFSEAIGELMMRSYVHLQLGCAVVALLHVVGERLYLGKSAGRLRLGLLAVLCAMALLGNFVFAPRLGGLNRARYGVNLPPRERQVAGESFDFWRRCFQITNVLLIATLGVYLWRLANPPETTRFLGPGQFRG